MPENKKLQIKLIHSAIGNQIRAKRTIKALGFHKLGETIVQADNETIRGMLYYVNHLVEVTEIEG